MRPPHPKKRGPQTNQQTEINVTMKGQAQVSDDIE
jgi:hypothetical protein